MPQLPTFEAVDNSDLPDYVEIPKSYFPSEIGPGGISPKTMYYHALALQKTFNHNQEIKSWVVLWLLDNVDWGNAK